MVRFSNENFSVKNSCMKLTGDAVPPRGWHPILPPAEPRPNLHSPNASGGVLVDVVYETLFRTLTNGELILSPGVTHNDCALDRKAIRDACLSRQVTVLFPNRREDAGESVARVEIFPTRF
jgi:hypothetical protein